MVSRAEREAASLALKLDQTQTSRAECEAASLALRVVYTRVQDQVTDEERTA